MAEIRTARGGLWVAAGPATADQPTLILIHGAGGTRLDWPAPLRQLPGVNVIAYDLAGHGRSTSPLRETVAEHAADLIALLAALPIPAAILAGHSLGGAVALQTALQAPERVAGLILISTAAHLPVNPKILELADDPPALAALLRDWFWGPEVPDLVRDIGEARMAALEPALLRADFGAAARYDVRTDLKQIAAPALVLCGSTDRMTRPALSEALRDHLPQAEAVFFEGAGHRLPEERSGEVAAAIHDWLTRLSRAR